MLRTVLFLQQRMNDRSNGRHGDGDSTRGYVRLCTMVSILTTNSMRYVDSLTRYLDNIWRDVESHYYIYLVCGLILPCSLHAKPKLDCIPKAFP